jgi:hypothetical protein
VSQTFTKYKSALSKIESSQTTEDETLQNTQKTLLPFVSSEQSDATISNQIEKAAVFCLAELDRQKGGGFFRKQQPEKTVFVSETYYPFWIVPFRNRTLLFDGLNIASHTIDYPSFPDSKTFMDNLSQRSSTRQIYATFLSNHLNYFKKNDGQQTRIVDGLIFDPVFLAEFMEYAKEATPIDAPLDGVLISPAQDQKQIAESIAGLENLRLQLEQEREKLNKIIAALHKQTQNALAALGEEIKAIENKYQVPIEKAKAALAEKTSKINENYSNRITEESDKFAQELHSLHKEIITLQNANDQINSEITEVENEIKSAVVNKDEVSEQKWKEKRNELKKQLPEKTAKIKDLEEKVQETEENKKSTFFQLSQENDAALKEASKDLIGIESSRDAEIKICKAEMEKIEDFTSTIIGKIDQFTKISESAINEFENLGIQKEQTSSTLTYLPFYFICYQSGPNKRYKHVGPSIASSGGISARLRAVGKARVTQLFKPRSQKIISILNSFLRMLEENVAFNHEINEASDKANLLTSKDKIELIRNGLSQLRTEGWLSESELESFSQILF